MKIQEKVLKEANKIFYLDGADEYKIERTISLTLQEVEKIIDENCPDNYCRTELKQKLKGEGK